MKKLLYAISHGVLTYASYWMALKVGPANGSSFIEGWLIIISIMHLVASGIYLFRFVYETMKEDKTMEIEQQASNGLSTRKCNQEYCNSRALLGRSRCEYHDK